MLDKGMQLKAKKSFFFLRNPGQIPGIHYLVQRLKASAHKSRHNNQHGASKNSQATPRGRRACQFLMRPVEEARTFLSAASRLDNEEKGVSQME